jgi:hypothetical protein
MTEIDLTNNEAHDQFHEQWEMDVRTGIVRLAQAVHHTAVDHGWWERGGEGQTFGEKVALMHSELSEALESYRDGEPVLWFKHNQDDGYNGEPHQSDPGPLTFDGVTALGKPEGAAAEFADAIIRIMDYCQHEEIPLAEALIRKHAYNVTRPHKHGGKRI